MGEENSYFLLIHTMTITQTDCVVQAQFFHACSGNLEQFTLVGKRMSLRVHPHLRSRSKSNLQLLNSPNLRCLMKKNSANVKHHLRTVQISPHIGNNFQIAKADTSTNISKNQVQNHPVETKAISNSNNNIQISQYSTTEETTKWLTLNRFEKYLETFEKFSGDDMLRMSREDFIQVCGNADGIRLHNAIHQKTILPKLKLFICKENSPIFNAVYLSSHTSKELVDKLVKLLSIPRNQVCDVYMEGPQSIHVQLDDDVLKHIKEEAMFSIKIIQQDNNVGYVLLLKRKFAQQ